jgi:hypothetical protein
MDLVHEHAGCPAIGARAGYETDTSDQWSVRDRCKKDSGKVADVLEGQDERMVGIYFPEGIGSLKGWR